MTQTGFLVTPNRFIIEIEEVEFEKEISLKELYKHVGCSTLDVVRLGHGVDVWVDDEGLMKSGNIVSEYSVDGLELQLAGNALFLSSDDEGGTIGLTDEQMRYVRSIKVKPFGEVS